MTMTHSYTSRRRLDPAGATLLLVALVCGVASYWLVVDRGVNPLVLVPSVVAATVGASHVTKREVTRRK